MIRASLWAQGRNSAAGRGFHHFGKVEGDGNYDNPQEGFIEMRLAEPSLINPPSDLLDLHTHLLLLKTITIHGPPTV
jgi:hypothetical protein